MEEELKVQIKGLLESVAASREKPPYTAAELVVMFAVLHPHSTGPQLLQLIVLKLKYYNRLAFDYAIFRGNSWPSFQEQFVEAFLAFESPLRRQSGSDVGVRWYHIIAENTKIKWKVPQMLARTFLSKKLGYRQQEESTGPFRFMDLPPELRNIIYTMVLDMPRSGVAVLPAQEGPETHWAKGKPARGIMVTRDFSKSLDIANWKAIDHATWKARNPNVFESQPLCETLAILATSKQIKSEAIGLFFNNTFVFQCAADLAWFLSKLPQERRDLLRHVVLLYQVEATRATKAFELLAKCKNLKKLDFFIDEQEWMSMTTARGKVKYPTALKIPGIGVLAKKMRGLTEVNFHGQCPELTSALRTLMMQPKSR